MTDAPATRDDASDPELDAAILAHDQLRTMFVLRNRAVRRRMAIIAFVNLIFGVTGLIAFGLSSDAAAQRITMLASIIIAYMFTLAGYVSVYMGVSGFDNRTMLGGGGMYGGGMGGMGGYGAGFSPGGYSALRSVSPIASPAAPHAPLIKTPVAAGAAIPPA